ncbi:MAG: 4Fe-4S cluster-binding domain-containing protein [Tannerella sp.]|jgi:radical SAM protein with 4Fe4S-binding SPASM domain|nr:4Fe-4S cluster-binding domain-containing protein [Tannerella sp.]
MIEKKEKTFSVLLTITNQCNLKCRYCYEHNKNREEMSLDMGKTIISHLFEEMEEKEDTVLEFDFHGGEPLLNFSFIREICEWTWRKTWKSKYRFFGTTNGTAWSSEIKKWFAANKDKISFALSIDGTPRMNYENRGCILSGETIDFFAETWPKQPVKMTVSKETIKDMFEGIAYLHSKGFNISANLAYGMDWDDTWVDIYRRELDKLVRYYIASPHITPCSLFDHSLIGLLDESYVPRLCGAGKNMKSFDTNGQSYPCQMFGPNTLPEWKQIKDDFEDERNLQDAECLSCNIYKICSTCYGMNFIERGSVAKRDRRLCACVKAEREALATWKLHNIMAKDRATLNKSDYLELKAIQKLKTETESES